MDRVRKAVAGARELKRPRIEKRDVAAGLAMQVLRDAPSTEVVQCGSQVALDVLVGRSGRHTSSSAYSPGTLPADRPELTDPGLALAIFCHCLPSP